MMREISNFEEADKSEINYRYNPNLNYAPEMSSDGFNGFYVTKKQQSRGATPGTYNMFDEKTPRSNLKSAGTAGMSRTGSSFNRVRFKEPPITEENGITRTNS